MSSGEHLAMSDDDASWLLNLSHSALKHRGRLAEDFQGEVLAYLCERWETQPSLREAVQDRNARIVIRAIRKAAEKAADALVGVDRAGGRSIAAGGLEGLVEVEAAHGARLKTDTRFVEWQVEDFVELGRWISEDIETVPADIRERVSLLQSALIAARGNALIYAQAICAARGNIGVAAEVVGLKQWRFMNNIDRLLSRMNRYSAYPSFERGRL